MSQANVIASFANQHLPAACAAGAAAAGISWPDDEDVFSPSAEPYPSCRFYLLEEGSGQLEGTTLSQVSLRIPAVMLDEWASSKFREHFRKALRFSFTSQFPRRAYLPCFDYEQSDDPQVAVGQFRIEQAGSRFFRMSWDGPDIRLIIAQFNLFNQS